MSSTSWTWNLVFLYVERLILLSLVPKDVEYLARLFAIYDKSYLHLKFLWSKHFEHTLL